LTPSTVRSTRLLPPPAAHDVRVLCAAQQRLERRGPHLQVGGQEDRDVAAGGQQAFELARVAADVLARLVVDRAEERDLGLAALEDLARAVGAAIVDQHDLVLARVPRERGDALVEQAVEVPLLVERGDHERDRLSGVGHPSILPALSAVCAASRLDEPAGASGTLTR
jgi:hypothetical protein